MTNLVGDENVVLQSEVRAAEICAAKYHPGDGSASTFESGVETSGGPTDRVQAKGAGVRKRQSVQRE